MKIFLVTTHLNVGGITSYLYALCRQYLNREHQVFLASAGGLREKEFEALGVVLLKVPALRTKAELSPRIYWHLPQLLKFMRQHKVDIIHSHTRVTQVLGEVLSLLTGVPYVSTCHGFYKLRWFRRWFLCWGRAVAAISAPVKEHLVKDFKVHMDKVFLIPNGIDLEYFHPIEAQVQNQARIKFKIQQGPIIGIVARLADVKGHTYLIEAMPCILKQFPTTKLFIAGEGKMEEELKSQVARLGLNEHVIFASVFNQSGDILALLDVLVMPSLDEGFGLSGMEAQAAGLPVVASNVGGIPSFIHHEKTGLLVPAKDSRALAEAILRILKDRKFADQLGKQARRFIEDNFSAQATAEKTLRMYERVMKH